MENSTRINPSVIGNTLITQYVIKGPLRALFILINLDSSKLFCTFVIRKLIMRTNNLKASGVVIANTNDRDIYNKYLSDISKLKHYKKLKFRYK